MEKKWALEVEESASKPGAYVIRFGMKASETGHLTDLIAPCGSIEEFEREVSRLAKDLNELPQQARKRLEAFATMGAGSQMEPAAVWKEMAALSAEKEMITHFNTFDEQDRKAIAEYVFTHVNMFKGRGPFFSEHYDSTSHLLEQ